MLIQKWFRCSGKHAVIVLFGLKCYLFLSLWFKNTNHAPFLFTAVKLHKIDNYALSYVYLPADETALCIDHFMY